MTTILFVSIFTAWLGFFCGKIFKGFNPFYIFFGGLILLVPAAQFLIELDSFFYSSAFVVGFLYNYGNPFGRILGAVEEVKMGWLYRRSMAGARDSLSDQKEEIEAELLRQKQTAEDEIRSQEEEVMARLRREAEELNRQREKFQKEQSQAKSQGQSSGSNRSFDPNTFSGACEILGCSPDSDLATLKKAYRILRALYHPDKINQLGGRRKIQAEEEIKLINLAWDTVKSRR